jgi:hypothetical protein
MSAPTAYKESVTVPLPSDSDIRAVVGEDYDPATRLNVLKMFAGTEEFYPVLLGMVRAIFGTTDIDDKHREMIILRAATVLDVPYEWQANKVMAENAGLTETEIQAAGGDGPVSGIAPDYVLICAATDELLRNGTLTDETLMVTLAAGRHASAQLAQQAGRGGQLCCGRCGHHRHLQVAGICYLVTIVRQWMNRRF